MNRIKRLPIVRHVRWWIAARRLKKHVEAWSCLGCMGPSQSDLEYLDAIWRGEQ
jgi:hypothetical protein